MDGRTERMEKPAVWPVVKMEIDGRIGHGKAEAPTGKDESRENGGAAG